MVNPRHDFVRVLLGLITGAICQSMVVFSQAPQTTGNIVFVNILVFFGSASVCCAVGLWMYYADEGRPHDLEGLRMLETGLGSVIGSILALFVGYVLL